MVAHDSAASPFPFKKTRSIYICIVMRHSQSPAVSCISRKVPRTGKIGEPSFSFFLALKLTKGGRFSTFSYYLLFFSFERNEKSKKIRSGKKKKKNETDDAWCPLVWTLNKRFEFPATDNGTLARFEINTSFSNHALLIFPLPTYDVIFLSKIDPFK